MANIQKVKEQLVNLLPSPKFWLKRWWGKPVVVFVFACGLVLIWAQMNPAQANPADTLATYMLRMMNSGLEVIANLISGILLWLFHFIIQLSGYNNFLNARVVSIGWSLTRDVANMFYILVLLAIAFGTMLKIERFDWRKNLPRLLFTALLVNFSKTIIGVLIDFGQVVMLTFVNGYAATAGGNFITMFGIENLFKLQTTGEPPPGQQVPYAITMGYILGVVILGISVIVVAVFAAILLFRIIMLWILIVLAPLAFLAGAVPVSKFAGYYSRWWEQLINNIVVGPVVAFFLWLSLATMGSGNNITEITDNNAIPESILKAQGEAGVGGMKLPGSSTEVSTWENLGSFAVSIAMLFAGLQFIQELGVAGAGLASSAGGMMKGLATKAVRSPLTVARLGAGLAWKGTKAGVKAGGRLGIDLTAPARADIWGSLGKEARKSLPQWGKNVGGLVGLGRLGEKVGGLAGSAVAGVATRRVGRVKAELEKSAEQKVRDLRKAPLGDKMDMINDQAFTPSGKIARGEMLESMITDRNFASKAKEVWGPDAQTKVGEVMTEYTTYAAGDKDKMDKLDEFKNRNPHLLAPDPEVGKVVSGLKTDDVTKLGTDALNDPRVVGALMADERKVKRLEEKGSEAQRQTFARVSKTPEARVSMENERTRLADERRKSAQDGFGGLNKESNVTQAATAVNAAPDIKAVPDGVINHEVYNNLNPAKQQEVLQAGKLNISSVSAASVTANNGRFVGEVLDSGNQKTIEQVQKVNPEAWNAGLRSQLADVNTQLAAAPPAAIPALQTRQAELNKHIVATEKDNTQVYTDAGYTTPTANPADKGNFATPAGEAAVASAVQTSTEPPPWLEKLKKGDVVKLDATGVVTGMTKLGEVLGKSMSLNQLALMAQKASTTEEKNLVAALAATKKKSLAVGSPEEKRFDKRMDQAAFDNISDEMQKIHALL